MLPTLTAAYKDLVGDVGFFLGHGRGELNGEEAWEERAERSILRYVKGGIRAVYFSGYEWSFLKPVATFILLEGEQRVHLPDDYGSLCGQITVSVSGTSGFWPVELGGDVRQYYVVNPDETGPPKRACIDPLKGAGKDGQKFDLFVFPEADQDYTLEVAYSLNPDFISGDAPYVYGGPQHSETFLESCLAVAERLGDDIANGPHQLEFARLLRVSQDLDRRNKPQNLGYNRDRSDGRDLRFGNWHWQQNTIATYDGVTPE